MKTVVFHNYQLTLRGIEVAIYNYAYYNQLLLGNTSIILLKKNSEIHPEALKKFSKQFLIVEYSHTSEIDSILISHKADLFYVQKYGYNDGVYSTKVKTFVHVVFQVHQPHGDYYYYISQWLANKMGSKLYLPYICVKLRPQKSLRDELGIPADALVFGRYGGWETFDIAFVKKAIIDICSKDNKLYFLFMNTDNFIDKSFFTSIKEIFNSRYGKKVRVLNLLLYFYLLFKNKSKIRKKVLFLKGTSNEQYKADFINTCDAMLHARKQGESFGLACAEFSMLNKPVYTYALSDEKAHIDIMKEKCVLYFNYKNIITLFSNFKKPHPSDDWDAYSKYFNPEKVMNEFRKIL